MNIVAEEGRLGMLNKIIKTSENTSTQHKFDMLLFKEQKNIWISGVFTLNVG